ncbi:hypothetical protein BKA70DRAFT_174745 [Coprinopsis sp. MPI-PUGE-AT-0042]|nr:hypothetical protein BKA70DRAFT_174745 [Coprinopsis sp. MPI-PUGE-AT-0042]
MGPVLSRDFADTRSRSRRSGNPYPVGAGSFSRKHDGQSLLGGGYKKRALLIDFFQRPFQSHTVPLVPSPFHLASTKAISTSRLVCCYLSRTTYTRLEFVEGDPPSYFDRRSQPCSSCCRYLKIPLLVCCLGLLLHQAVNQRRLGSKDNDGTGNRSHTWNRHHRSPVPFLIKHSQLRSSTCIWYRTSLEQCSVPLISNCQTPSAPRHELKCKCSNHWHHSSPLDPRASDNLLSDLSPNTQTPSRD